jgi:hypothetical protein
MSSAKRKITKIVAIVIGIFAVLNLFCFGWRQIRYSSSIDGMEQTELSTLLVPRYAAKDRDSFDYSVKWPEYLSLTGNLTVGFPGISDDPFTDGLIIWLKIFGGYEYGVILKDPNDPSNGYMFYITPDGQAIDAEYQDIAVQCQTTIKELLERANEYWEIINK